MEEFNMDIDKLVNRFADIRNIMDYIAEIRNNADICEQELFYEMLNTIDNRNITNFNESLEQIIYMLNNAVKVEDTIFIIKEDDYIYKIEDNELIKLKSYKDLLMNTQLSTESIRELFDWYIKYIRGYLIS